MESDIKDFESCFNINVRAPFIFCKEFSKEMIEKRWGRIVNIGSSSAYAGFKETSIYCASSPDLEGVSGKYFKKRKEAKSVKASYDEELARKLWDLSVELTNLK